jgi:hypothetical protein
MLVSLTVPSPEITEAILGGRQHAAVNVRLLTLTDAIVGDWSAQANVMLAKP